MAERSGGLFMLISRKAEKKSLMNAWNKGGPQFIAIYGRRRIGKTYLVKEVYGDKFVFHHSGVALFEEEEKRSWTQQAEIQLSFFKSSLMYHWKKELDDFTDWKDAFRVLKLFLDEKAATEKCVVFLDELAWMDTPGSSFLSAFENFYNSYVCLKDNIVLVCCASATTWMLRHIIYSSGGLMDRVTCAIHLLPFTLKECEQYAAFRHLNMTREQILRTYMIFGGVAFYWDLLEPDQSLEQNIDRLFFAPGSIHRQEFLRLYRSLFKKDLSYLSLIRALGQKRMGLSRDELAKIGKVAAGGSFSEKLEDLESSGFIRSYKPFGKQKRGTLYQLIDNFTLFYLEFIENGSNDDHYFLHLVNQAKMNNWEGRAFEIVCLENITSIKSALGISGVYTEISSFRCLEDKDKGIKGHQIDLVISRKDKVIHLIEMKYGDKPFIITKHLYDDWRNRVPDFIASTGTTSSVLPTLIAPKGLASNLYSNWAQIVLDEDDLFLV